MSMSNTSVSGVSAGIPPFLQRFIVECFQPVVFSKEFRIVSSLKDFDVEVAQKSDRGLTRTSKKSNVEVEKA